jgi:hypothetical protein
MTLKKGQRGDLDVTLCVLLLFVLFWGTPDVWDGLQAWAKWAVKHYAVEQPK